MRRRLRIYASNSRISIPESKSRDPECPIEVQCTEKWAVSRTFFSQDRDNRELPICFQITMQFLEARSSLTARDFARAWWRVLNGYVPLLSIEITRECPLSCPGCYAYGNDHLGDGVSLRELSDLRGDQLVEGVLRLVRSHRPCRSRWSAVSPWSAIAN